MHRINIATRCVYSRRCDDHEPARDDCLLMRIPSARYREQAMLCCPCGTGLVIMSSDRIHRLSHQTVCLVSRRLEALANERGRVSKV